MNTLRIANLTFREAVRRKALYGAIALTLAILAVYAWGTGWAVNEIYTQTPRGAIVRLALQSGVDVRLLAVGELLLAGLFAVSNIAGLLAIFLAAGTIAQEIEQGTLHSILCKPIARWQVVLGKWLGGSAMLSVYVAVTASATVAIIYWHAGYVPSNLPLGIALLTLKAMLLFSVTMIGSAFAPAIATGIAMFIVYVAANVAGMVEQIGVAAEIEAMVRTGIVASLILPSDALWKMSASAVQPPNPLPALGIKLSVGPFGVVEPPSVWMGVYAALYTAAALGLTTLIFSRRDV
ncbi:MAG: ABC transporter permease subunit [Chloroflexi bacterium]|nr:ABC transporter permease subunit [Chloroflexota bacterium]